MFRTSGYNFRRLLYIQVGTVRCTWISTSSPASSIEHTVLPPELLIVMHVKRNVPQLYIKPPS